MGQRAIPSRISRHSYHPGEQTVKSKKLDYRVVVQGSDDQIAPPENGALLKQELGERATLVSFPGAGHLFIVTEPNKAAAAVVSFLHLAFYQFE